MRRSSVAMLGITLLICGGLANASDCIVKPECAFADEYIREIAALERVVEQVQADQLTVKNNTNQMSSMIYSTRAMILVLQSNIDMLKGHSDNQENRTMLSNLYSMQLGYMNQLNRVAVAFASGPTPGVNYGELAADVPQIRAEMEDANKLYMTMSNLVFAQLIDKEPDANNHMSRLVITKAERRDLIDHINRAFAGKLESKNASGFCNGAWVLRAQLQKGFTASDEVKLTADGAEPVR